MPLEADQTDDRVDCANAPEDVRPPVMALVRQLADDARAFALAESRFVQARLGEGWGHAKPGFVAIGAALGLAFGLVITLPIGLMMALAPLIGLLWSVLAVVVGGGLIALVLVKFGTGRIKAALKMPEDR